MKNTRLFQSLALLLACVMLLGLCSCSRLEDYAEEPAAESTPIAETTPEAAPETTPEAAPETAPETTPETAPEAAPENAPETTPETAPETTPETAPETTPETAPETTPEAAPETTPEIVPEGEETGVGPVSEEAVEETAEPMAMETLTDEDGDGIISYSFHYKGATVYALIILDPARVYVGTAVATPTPYGRGLTLDKMAEQYGAIAGLNAGGFKDEEGVGTGWPPRGITFSNGIMFEGEQYGPIAGLDYDNHLWAGYYTYEDCLAVGIRDAVCFGPYLVMNGVKTDPAELETGIGARTMVGQREDGAIVLVAIDGRQGYSIGVTFADCVDIMADKFGCVNAANMDGGNSTSMYFYGEAVNRSANKAGGTRDLPDAWLVNPLPEGYVRPEGVPESISLPENALGEIKTYVGECDEETKERMYDFVWAFALEYYSYFGSPYYEKHYSGMLQYVAQDCDLRHRAELALMDRKWVNTWGTEPKTIVVDGAYINEDGSYDVLITLDVIERSEYWKYEANGTHLRITMVDAPGTAYGFLVTDTY